MKILFLYCNTIAAAKGGIERWTASVCAEFEKRGHVCFYLAAKSLWKEFADPRHQHFLPDEKDFGSAENAEFFEKFLTEKRIERVIYLWGDGKRFPFAEICRGKDVPVVAAIRSDPEFYRQRFRGNDFISRIKRFWRFRRQVKIYRHNAQCCAATVLLSPRFVPAFSKHFPHGKPAGKVVAIPNPCAIGRVPVDFSAKKKELLFVGRMEMAVKQPQLLLEIWAKLQNRFPEWTLRMVGGAHDFEKVKALAGTLGLKNVFFEGFQKPEKFYRDASIFCMTSAFEGFPNVLIEAANYGCVPVAFDAFGAVFDIIEENGGGANGIVVPAFDLEKYAEKLAELMENPDLWERLAKNALSINEKFSPEKIGARWEQLFRGNTK